MNEDEARLRHELADAAEHYDWGSALDNSTPAPF